MLQSLNLLVPVLEGVVQSDQPVHGILQIGIEFLVPFLSLRLDLRWFIQSVLQLGSRNITFFFCSLVTFEPVVVGEMHERKHGEQHECRDEIEKDEDFAEHSHGRSPPFGPTDAPAGSIDARMLIPQRLADSNPPKINGRDYAEVPSCCQPKLLSVRKKEPQNLPGRQETREKRPGLTSAGEFVLSPIPSLFLLTCLSQTLGCGSAAPCPP